MNYGVTRRIALTALVQAACAVMPVQSAGAAENYPSKPIRFVVGGGPDTLARVLGQKLTEAWGKQVVVDQRGGGGGSISAELVAKASPDGYTILLATSTHATHAVTPGSNVTYDLVRDFTPVSLLASTAFILSVNPSLPAKSVEDLIRLARARPDALNYGTAGEGSPPHLTTELLKSMAGIRMVHVPYKTVAAALTDLMSGQLQVMFVVAPSGLPQIRAGRIRALAVSSARRSPLAPEIPSVAESGVPGFDIFTWNGVLAPAGTSKAVVTRLHGELTRSLRLPDVQERVANSGFEPVGSTPEEFGSFVRNEIARWTKVAKLAGARIE